MEVRRHVDNNFKFRDELALRQRHQEFLNEKAELNREEIRRLRLQMRPDSYFPDAVNSSGNRRLRPDSYTPDSVNSSENRRLQLQRRPESYSPDSEEYLDSSFDDEINAIFLNSSVVESDSEVFLPDSDVEWSGSADSWKTPRLRIQDSEDELLEEIRTNLRAFKKMVAEEEEYDRRDALRYARTERRVKETVASIRAHDSRRRVDRQSGPDFVSSHSPHSSPRIIASAHER